MKSNNMDPIVGFNGAELFDQGVMLGVATNYSFSLYLDLSVDFFVFHVRERSCFYEFDLTRSEVSNHIKGQTIILHF